VSSIIVGPALMISTIIHDSKKRIKDRIDHVENSRKIFLNKFLQSFHLNAADANKIVARANRVIDPSGKNKTMICARIVSDINPQIR
jgi:hypothetical protein